MTPRMSVVIATYGRPESLMRLVAQLLAQSVLAGEREIIVVDDGSPAPVAPFLAERFGDAVAALRLERGGAGAARHAGALQATGDILVFVDDDMQVDERFLEAHRVMHKANGQAVVFGRIRPDPSLAAMPVFERYHARQLERFRAAALAGKTPLRGMQLCTGNVSMRRRDYVAAGGFNATLARSEDRELGIRLEKLGCLFLYADAAATVHSSDHDDPVVWRRRAYLYGRYDRRIAGMHPDRGDAHPWRYWSLIAPVSRPLVGLGMIWPSLGSLCAAFALALAGVCDRLRLRSTAVTLTALTFALDYFRGLRDECGSWRALRAEVRAMTPRRDGAWRRFRAAVRADHDSVRRYRLKYHGEDIGRGKIAIDLVRKVGLQTMFAYRVMRLFDEWRVPLLPMALSRLIRHVYAAEIHWKARLAPGVSVVHGVGLVISHAAVVGEGCILFHNVTLGENTDPVTGRVGAPVLENDVHVGPGAVLLGPIVVGGGTKISANAVLARSVPAFSLVGTPESAVVSRRRPAAAPAVAEG